MNIDFSLEHEPRGYACLHSDGKNMTIFLDNVADLLPHLNSPQLPFRSVEDLIEEWVIHELLHKITKIQSDKIIDGWHVLLCRSICLEGSKIPEIKDCSCPIDCFWRDVYC